MTTITRERIEQYANDPRMCNVNDEIRQIARIALASLTAEPVKRVNADQMHRVCLEANRHLDKYTAMAKEVNKLLGRTTQPAPVSVPDDLAKAFISAIEKEQDRLFGEDYLMDSKDCVDVIREEAQRLNAFRAAMLQGSQPVSQPDELPMDYMQGHKDGLEWAAQLAEANHPQTGDWLYDDPIELAKAIRKGPHMPELKLVPADADDNFYSWFGRFWHENYQQNNYTTSAKQMLGTMAEFAFRAGRESANQAVNSPVIPDGYVVVPKRLTAENGAKNVLVGEFSETKFINCPECFGDDECETCDGSGRIKISVPVSWTNIKAIWAKGVELFAAVPQQEAE